MSQVAWYERSERGSALGMRITVACYRAFGRGLALGLLPFIVGYFWATDASARRSSRAYLARLGLPAGARQSFRHFFEFGLSILDRVGIWLGDERRFALELHGGEHLDRVRELGRGAVVIGSHLGNLDALRLLALRDSPIPVNLLMYTRHAARINAVFAELGALGPPGARVRVIEVARDGFEHVLEALKCVERGEVVAVLADRVPPSEARRLARAEFLGAPAAFPQGPFLLAALLACPVLTMFALRGGANHYEIHVEWLADRIVLPRAARGRAVAEWCQRFADRLAFHCARAPYQWFNFHDFWSEGAP
jgi:predicted LPLAT superfamily acyltransferase